MVTRKLYSGSRILLVFHWQVTYIETVNYYTSISNQFHGESFHSLDGAHFKFPDFLQKIKNYYILIIRRTNG